MTTKVTIKVSIANIRFEWQPQNYDYSANRKFKVQVKTAQIVIIVSKSNIRFEFKTQNYDSNVNRKYTVTTSPCIRI